MILHNIIPAAGLATRFLPASKAIPKEMFPVVDKPVIQYIVEEAVDCGLTENIFVTGEGKEMIADHFDRINPKFPLEKLKPEIRKAVDDLENLTKVTAIRQKQPKGLGHAVLQGAELIEGEAFSVMLPDVMLFNRSGTSCMQRMVDIFNETNRSVIALMKVPDEDRKKYGMAEGTVQNGVMEVENLVEKPGIDGTDSNYAIVGRYIFTPEITPILKTTKPGVKGEIQLTDAMLELNKTQKFMGVILDENDYVFDAGDKDGYAMANAFVAAMTLVGFKDNLLTLLEK